MNLILYWEGENYSLIKLFRKIIYKNCSKYNIIFLTDDNIHNYIKKFPKNYDKLCIAHKADFIRIYMLYYYGGIWLDSDTLVIKNLDEYFKCLDYYDNFLIFEEEDILCNGFMGSKKRSDLFKVILSNIIYKIENKENLTWCDIGSIILNKLLKEQNELFNKTFFLKGYEDIYCIHWKYCKDILLLPCSNKLINTYDCEQDLLITVNSLYKELKDKSEKDILNDNILLSYFLKKSLKDETINKERVIVYADWIENYIAKEHYEVVLELEKLGWIKIKLSELNNKKIVNSIILFFTYDDLEILKDNYKKNLLIYNLHDIYIDDDNIFNKRIKNCEQVDFIISAYQYLFKDDINLKHLVDKSFWIPNSIPQNMITIFNKNVTNKILVSGFYNDYIIPYSFRYLVSKIAKNEKFKNYFDILEHSGYKNENHNITGKKYTSYLSNYKCCFTDANDYKYLLLKYFEILGSGSLLLCDDSIKEQLEELGFKDGENCIMCNKKNIYEKIHYIINNDIENIRYEGYKLAFEHTSDIRANKINKLFQLSK